jgi:hypothetical protein
VGPEAIGLDDRVEVGIEVQDEIDDTFQEFHGGSFARVREDYTDRLSGVKAKRPFFVLGTPPRDASRGPFLVK